jgi:hypothetical protein
VLVARASAPSEHHTRHRQSRAHRPWNCSPTISTLPGVENCFPFIFSHSRPTGRSFTVIFGRPLAREDKVLGSFVELGVGRPTRPKGNIINVALSLHLLHFRLSQLPNVVNVVIATPEHRLHDPRTVGVLRSLALPRVTPTDGRAVGSSEVSDAVAEGVLASRCGVLWGDEAFFDLDALVSEAADGLFEVHEDSGDCGGVIGVGGVSDVDDHHVGAEASELWLGGLAGVIHRCWWS